MKYDLVLKLMKFIDSYIAYIKQKLKLLKPHVLKPILKCVVVAESKKNNASKTMMKTIENHKNIFCFNH